MAGGDNFELVEGGNLWKVAAFTDHQFADARGFGGAHPVPPGLHAIAQHVGAAALKALKLSIPLWKLTRDVVPHHSLEKIFFAGEIQKHRAFGDAGTLGHFFHAGGGKAFFYKEVECGIKEFTRARLFAPGPLGRGGTGLTANLRKRHAVDGLLLTDWLVM